ncbi:MAG: CHAT domain-containing protein [Magnetococcales bacterium]|nr:CHAT domain-containing protein [Magnetococcales bacterium]
MVSEQNNRKKISKHHGIGMVLCAVMTGGMFLSGCGADNWSVQRHLQEGNYANAVSAFEKKGGLATADMQRLFYGCEAYVRVRHFSNAQACIKRLKAELPPGFKPLGAWKPSDAQVQAVVDTWQSTLHLGLGRFDEAARLAVPAVTDLENVGANARNTDHNKYLFMAFETAGVALANQGRDRDAATMAARLERFTLVNDSVIRAKGIALTRIHMARKDFASAHRIITDPTYEKAFSTDFTISNDDLGTSPAVGLGGMGGGMGGGGGFASTKKKFLQQGEEEAWQKVPRLYMMARSALETGNLEEAEKSYDELMDVDNLADFGSIHWMTLYDRGRIALKNGNEKEAISGYSQAMTAIETQRATLKTEADKIGFAGDKQNVYRDLIALHFKRRDLDSALNVVERSKARALVDMLSSRADRKGRQAASPELSSLLEKLDRAEAALEEQTDADDASAVSRKRSAVLSVQKEIARIDPETASLISVTPPDIQELQRQLPADETLIEYYGDGDRWYAFVVTRTSITGVPIDGRGLTGAISDYRAAIQRPDSSYRRHASRLHARLIAPLASQIPAGGSLTVVPHGPLHYLPFAGLLDGTGRFLVDRYAIRVLPSAGVLAFLKPSGSDGRRTMLILGNPDLGNPDLDLPFAEKEARALASTHRDSKLLVRSAASESAFRTLGSHYNHLHVASHGKFDAADPMGSGLYLSEGDGHDGRLTVRELYGLDLNADLVTLSACETGLGKIASGDDVVGLNRGFLYAGASTVVSSLWEVDDLATKEMMLAFYAALATENPRSALRTAQRKVKSKSRLRHPFFWAAFQVTGSVK